MPRPTLVPTLVLLVAAPVAALAAGPRVTVYSHDLAYVEEMRTLTLTGSRDTLRIGDVPDRIDFSSVRLDAGGAAVERLAYRFDVASGDGLLEHALGRRIRVVSQQRERASEGVLVSADGSWLTLRADDGGMIVIARTDVGEVRLPDAAKGLSLRPTLEVVLADGRRGDTPASLEYLTGGLSWAAEHRLVRTGETSGRWSTAVTVDNQSGREYRDARLRLVAGEPQRTGGNPTPRPMMMKTMAMEAAPAADMVEQNFSEYHLYTLEHPALLRDRESQSLVMLGERSVKLEPRYLVRAGATSVLSQIRLVNDAASGLGVPLPGGRVRVFEPDGAGGNAFTGESAIGHTAAGEKLVLDVGTAFDLAVERRDVSSKRISDRERENTVEIKLRDRKKTDVKIVVEESVGGDFDVTNETFKSTRKDANTLQWEIPVKAGGEAVLTYTVHVRF